MTASRPPPGDSPPVARLSELRRSWPGGWTAAQIAALAFGLWWIGNGIAVFAAAEPSVTTVDANGSVEFLGTSIAVNGWHGLFHLATGFAGVAACRSPRGSRVFSLGVGVLYTAAALYGLLTSAAVFGLIRVDELGSADHAVEGVLLLASWLVSGERRQPAAAR